MRDRFGQWAPVGDVIVGVVCLAIAVSGVGNGLRDVAAPSVTWSQLPLFVLATLSLPFRRVLPVTTFTVVVSSVSVLCAIGWTPFVLDVPVAFAAYSLAVSRGRRSALVVLLAGQVVLGAATSVALLRGTVDGYVIHTMLATGALWFAGDAVRSGRLSTQAVAERAEIERTEHAERARSAARAERIGIARELHDVVAHSLTVMTVQAGVGARIGRAAPAAALEALQSIERTGRSAQDELRVVLGVLRDESGTTAPLSPTPGLDELGQLVEQVRRSGTDVALIRTDTHAMSASLELTVYRIVQEALTNVVRHADGATAEVWVGTGSESVQVTVTNTPGRRSLASEPGTSGVGHGLIGMRERVRAFGGSLDAGPRPAGGFRVSATIPRTPSTPLLGRDGRQRS